MRNKKSPLDVRTLSVDALARHHNVDRLDLELQLKLGIDIELEHTTDRSVAREIALDHLGEDPQYYTKLRRANLEESVYDSSGLTMARSAMSGYQIERAYYAVHNRRRDNGEAVVFQPYAGLMEYVERCASRALWESKSIDSLSDFQKYLRTLDQRSSVKLAPGAMISVLQFVPITTYSVIQVLGFKNPKRVKRIDRNVDGNVNWIEFADGSYFPDAEFHHNGIGGEWEGSSNVFFSSFKDADSALMLAMIHGADGWKISVANLQESVVSESSGYIPSESERNDPRWKTALSVDVGPETMRRQAAAMGLGALGRDGRPPMLRKRDK